jgi:HSP20 family molecular chaperone IbpA
MRYIVTRRPARAAENRDLFSQMDRMLDSIFNDEPDWEFRSPQIDVREEDDRYLMEADLPGYSDKDVNLRVEENLLILEAKKEEKKKEESKGYILRERSSLGFKRSFVLPKDVDATQISAAMKNGMLTLELKKSEAAKPRTIEVKVK